jgi:glycosyltransferase involved in cell wall biosynthesis
MRLLIVTQVIDTEHPILGFFHRWVEEFAAQCERIHVICLEAGKYDLPANVTIHSLGKENGGNKLMYTLRFYSLIFKLRREYDGVFVHMIPIYAVLGGLPWKLLRKPVGLWYTHGSVTMSLKVANALVDQIFTASPDSCNLKSQKIMVTGHGIDTEHFKPDPGVTKDIDLITVGRITKSKNLTALIEVLREVRKQHDVTLTIVGAAVTPEEKAYEQTLREQIKTQNLNEHAHFIGRVGQKSLPPVLNRAKIFVTAAQNGSLDKAVLEAMACGLPVVSMAPGTQSLPLGDFQVIDFKMLENRIESVLQSGMFEDQTYYTFVAETHSIKSLIPKITEKLS